MIKIFEFLKKIFVFKKNNVFLRFEKNRSFER